MNAPFIPLRHFVQKTGSVSISFDPESRIVRIHRIGYQTAEQMGSQLDQLARILSALRSAGIAIRVLVDMREAQLHPANAQSDLAKRASEIYRPEDKLALLVTSSLAKMQMRRITNEVQRGAQVEHFVSANAAELWLSAGC